MFYYDTSAKQAEVNEITPLSNYVEIDNDGNCVWSPRYELSIIQCAIDQTWFPFDEQTCDLVFHPWPDMQKKHLILHTDSDDISQAEYVESNEWEFIGK